MVASGFISDVAGFIPDARRSHMECDATFSYFLCRDDLSIRSTWPKEDRLVIARRPRENLMPRTRRRDGSDRTGPG